MDLSKYGEDMEWPWDDPWYVAEALIKNWNLAEGNRSWTRWEDDLPKTEESPDNWMAWNFDYYDPTHSLRNKVNVDVIRKRLRRFGQAGKNLVMTRNGLAVKIMQERPATKARTEEPTYAFRAVCELRDKLQKFGVLDEDKWLELQHEDTLENIKDVLIGHDLWEFCHSVNTTTDGHVRNGFAVVENAVHAVWRWMWENDQEALEADDDGGAYPSEEQMAKAIIGLGWTNYLRVYIEDKSMVWDRRIDSPTNVANRYAPTDTYKQVLLVEQWLRKYNPTMYDALMSGKYVGDPQLEEGVRQALAYLGWLEDADMEPEELRYHEHLRVGTAMKREGAKQLTLFKLSGDAKWLGPSTQVLVKFIAGEEIKGSEAGPF